jgi:micrococcal nuclease
MKPYYYVAEVVSVYDGDTCTCVVDLGFKTFQRIKVRLVGIDTPEIRTKDLEEKKKRLVKRKNIR